MNKTIDIERIKKEGVKRYSTIKEKYYYELYADDFPELFSEIERGKANDN